MQLGTLLRAPGQAPPPRLLLPGPLRAAGAALLAACVAVTVVLGVNFAGRELRGRLDSAFDPRIQAGLSRFPALLHWLPDLGTLGPVTLMTLALVLACVATRRWSGAVLAAVAVPAATGLTEDVLKPYVGSAIGQGFPSGHATSMFALAAICAVLFAGPPGRRVPWVVRLLLVAMALLLAAAVAAAMVALGAHVFTDAAAGAAVGTGVVLACALALDLAASRVRRAPAARSSPGNDQRRGRTRGCLARQGLLKRGPRPLVRDRNARAGRDGRGRGGQPGRLGGRDEQLGPRCAEQLIAFDAVTCPQASVCSGGAGRQLDSGQGFPGYTSGPCCRLT